LSIITRRKGVTFWHQNSKPKIAATCRTVIGSVLAVFRVMPVVHYTISSLPGAVVQHLKLGENAAWIHAMQPNLLTL
jgi:hypothetical protein